MVKITIDLAEYAGAHVDLLLREGWQIGDDGFERDYPLGANALGDLLALWDRLTAIGRFVAVARHVLANHGAFTVLTTDGRSPLLPGGCLWHRTTMSPPASREPSRQHPMPNSSTHPANSP